MQSILLSYSPSSKTYSNIARVQVTARGKTPRTKERMQPFVHAPPPPPAGHSRELLCRGVAPNTKLASCVACAGLFSSFWCVANSEQAVYGDVKSQVWAGS